MHFSLRNKFNLISCSVRQFEPSGLTALTQSTSPKFTGQIQSVAQEKAD